MAFTASRFSLLLLVGGAPWAGAVRSGTVAEVTEGLLEADAQFPLCKVVAPWPYPGGCNTTEASVACYSLYVAEVPVEVHSGPHHHIIKTKHLTVPWVCLSEAEADGITDAACMNREWSYEYTVEGETYKASEKRYRGVCSFHSPATNSVSSASSTTSSNASSNASSPAPAENTNESANTTSAANTTAKSAAKSVASGLRPWRAARASLALCLAALAGGALI